MFLFCVFHKLDEIRDIQENSPQDSTVKIDIEITLSQRINNSNFTLFPHVPLFPLY